jgi:hypothetical protein
MPWYMIIAIAVIAFAAGIGVNHVIATSTEKKKPTDGILYVIHDTKDEEYYCKMSIDIGAEDVIKKEKLILDVMQNVLEL